MSLSSSMSRMVSVPLGPSGPVACVPTAELPPPPTAGKYILNVVPLCSSLSTPR